MGMGPVIARLQSTAPKHTHRADLLGEISIMHMLGPKCKLDIEVDLICHRACE